MEAESSGTRGTIEKLATLIVGFLFGSGGLGAGIVYMGKQENTAAGEKIFLYTLIAGGIIFLVVVLIYLYELRQKEWDKKRVEEQRRVKAKQRETDRHSDLTGLAASYESLLTTTGSLVNDRLKLYVESQSEPDARLVAEVMGLMIRGLNDHMQMIRRLPLDQALKDAFIESIHKVITAWQGLANPQGGGG
ncbi:MAG: hypothetical protein ACM3QS_07885 [Bacteroidota bacterium]